MELEDQDLGGVVYAAKVQADAQTNAYCCLKTHRRTKVRCGGVEA